MAAEKLMMLTGSAWGGAPRSGGRIDAAASPDLRALAGTGPVHFVGISGAGMSAIAELLLRSGGHVTGCDLRPGGVADALRRAGAEILEGHSPDHVAGAVAVVTTAAVPADHPELRAARARGIPVIKRAAALGALVNHGTVLAVAGTHGKTTTTAMLTAILAEAGLDPTGFVGGPVPGWGGGLRAGSDRLFVVEADEYDRSFLQLMPRAAVVTTLEADHLDIYGSLEAVEQAFREFLAVVPEDGLIAGCVDDAGVRALLDSLGREAGMLGYGVESGASAGEGVALRATEIETRGRAVRFRVVLEPERMTAAGIDPALAPASALDLAVPGLHNVRNALGAVALALFAGADWGAVRRALAGFQGVGRRFQQLGEVRDIAVVDDYAHHPTEVEATLATARGAYPGRRLVAVFQPHLYTRTRDFSDAFGDVLCTADVVWVTDVYPAREQPIPGVTGELVARAAERAGGLEVHYHASLDGLADTLAAELEPGDVCITMGAGDIDRVAREVFEWLGAGEDGARDRNRTGRDHAPDADAGSGTGTGTDLRWHRDALLAHRLRYRVGGPAARLAEIDSAAGLVRALDELGDEPFLVLGGGANTVVSDEGVSQPVLVLGGELRRFAVEADAIVASAASPIPAVVQAARRHGRAGWHLLEAVPGTIGGALFMNAGSRAWGIWDGVAWAEAFLPGERTPVRLTAVDVHPGYRHTGAPVGTVFLAARLRAATGDRDAVERAHREFRDAKVRSQPYDRPSCGSIWTNPPGESVWRLIDGVGLRGERRGGAQISDRHTNFIVNLGDATAADIVALMLETRRRVLDRFGIALRPEVRLWGFPDALLLELGALEAGGESGTDVSRDAGGSDDVAPDEGGER